MDFVTSQLQEIAKKYFRSFVDVGIVYLHLLGLSFRMCSLRSIFLIPIEI